MKYVPKFQQGKPILNADLYTYPSAYLYDYFRSPKHKERVHNRIIEDYGGFPSLSQDKEFINKRVNSTMKDMQTDLGKGRIIFDKDEEESNYMSRRTGDIHFNTELPYDTVIPHELAHRTNVPLASFSAQYLDIFNRYKPTTIDQINVVDIIKEKNKKEDTFGKALLIKTFVNSLYDDDTLHGIHDLDPDEVRSDIYSLRFNLYKNGIYDARSKDFTPEHYRKAKLKFGNDIIFKRLFDAYSEPDLIHLMNTVVDNYDNKKSETLVAQHGGKLVNKKPPVLNLNYVPQQSQDNTYIPRVNINLSDIPYKTKTLPTVEIVATPSTPKYRNSIEERREDIQKIPGLSPQTVNKFPKSVQKTYIESRVAERPDYEGIKEFVNFAPMAVSPVPFVDPLLGIVGKGISKLPSTVKNVYKLNPWLKGYQEVPKNLPPKIMNRVENTANNMIGKNFKSEIDWGNWNKEIPSNKPLMEEYLQIEKTAKANGTWMKNPDGSKFQGTPEQFVQQNSSNFKKSFPNIIKEDGKVVPLIHHSRNSFDYFDEGRALSNTGMERYGRGVYTIPEPFYNKRVAKNLEELMDESSGKSVLTNYGDIRYDLYSNSNNITKHSHRNRINVTPKTKYEDIFTVVSPYTNRLKSAIGNNGMFDMTNPNIYKGLVPVLGISALIKSQQAGEGDIRKVGKNEAN